MIRPISEQYILLDHSKSCEDFLDELKRSGDILLEKLSVSPMLHGCDIKVNVFVFNHEYETICEHKPIKEFSFKNLDIKATGATDSGKVLLDVVQRAVSDYEYTSRAQGKQIKHPCIYCFTDGKPDGGVLTGETADSPTAVKRQAEADENYAKAAKLIRDYEKNKKLVFSAISVNSSDNVEKLKELTIYPDNVLELRTDDDKKKIDLVINQIIEKTTSSLTDLNNQFRIIK